MGGWDWVQWIGWALYTTALVVGIVRVVRRPDQRVGEPVALLVLGLAFGVAMALGLAGAAIAGDPLAVARSASALVLLAVLAVLVRRGHVLAGRS